MTPEQIMLVQMSWQEVEPLAVAFGETFYKKLFELAPGTRELFNGDLQTQAQTLSSMLSVAVNMLDKLAVIDPIVEDLGRRHLKYRVSAEHILPFREALLFALGWVLGTGFTNQVQAAWIELFDTLAAKMKMGAAAADTSK